MKFYLIVFFASVFLACKKDKAEIAQNLAITVPPIDTDIGYQASDQSHYVVRNGTIHLNKLLLFIGGSSSIPKNYNLICDHAASIGLDVISLYYSNEVPAVSVGNSTDELAFDHYRDEVCFGNQVSKNVSVDKLNSIETRTLKLLNYLAKKYPAQNWSQYLISNNLNWTKIIVAGHSQGSGHAGYLGKKKLVDRVLMFSGPNDYNTLLKKPGNWLMQAGKTPNSKIYALLHTKDEIVSYPNQLANLRAMGILGTDQLPILVDNLLTPMNNTRALAISFEGLSNHNATVGRNPKLPAVWSAMLLE
jgi:hypothetical protein